MRKRKEENGDRQTDNGFQKGKNLADKVKRNKGKERDIHTYPGINLRSSSIILTITVRAEFRSIGLSGTS